MRRRISTHCVLPLQVSSLPHLPAPSPALAAIPTLPASLFLTSYQMYNVHDTSRGRNAHRFQSNSNSNSNNLNRWSQPRTCCQSCSFSPDLHSQHGRRQRSRSSSHRWSLHRSHVPSQQDLRSRRGSEGQDRRESPHRRPRQIRSRSRSPRRMSLMRDSQYNYEGDRQRYLSL